MAKKRKASGQPSGQPKSKGSEKQSSKLNISTYEDVADSEDEFHINRDKILLDEGPEAKRRRKWKEQDEFLEQSDEEVLGYSSPEEDEDVDDDVDDDSVEGDSKARKAENEEEEEGWGPSKKDYYGADAIEAEQDALDEEAEALRIQQKQLQGMTEADFGFDETEWAGEDAEPDKDEARAGDVVTEVLPQLQIRDDMTAEQRHKILKTRYPEFDHLAKEFLDLQPLHDQLSLAATAAEHMVRHRAGAPKGSKTPTAVIKYQALSAYMAALAMYFALFTSTDNGLPKSPLELRDHPVMDGLIKCRDLWSKVKDLDITDNISADFDTAEEESAESEEEMADDLAPAKSSEKVPRKKKSKAQRAAEAAQAEAEARRAERLRKTEEELAALASLTDKSVLRKAAKTKSTKALAITANGDDSDIGDETELTAQELAEKARRKKSLRFYTSQIAQKANKRGASARDFGGDADIPHRERLRDRQARLNAEAEKRGKKQQSSRDELGGESDEEDRRQAREIRGEAGDSEDDYYDMVAARSQKKKADKQELAEAYAQAAKEGGRVVETETIGADGKRAITYAIEKNKGLTPHRKKDVRNPRVKKRKKFEEKKKKLKSIRQVYSGGEGRGGYKGELTGIKKGLVKSVKL